MSNIQTSAPALLGKSTGSTLAEIAVVRNGTAQRGSTRQTIAAPAENTANALHNLQTQIDQIKQALTAPLPALTSFNVVGEDGSQIVWIGTQTVGDQVYVGAWFKEIFIGGTSAANAVISTDSNGNVTINGAEIILAGNGVQTTLNNIVDPVTGFTESLQSLDISVANGGYSFISPYHIAMLAYNGSSYVEGMQINNSSAGGAEIILNNLSAGGSRKAELSVTGGAGAPFLLLTDGTSTTNLTQNQLTMGSMTLTPTQLTVQTVDATSGFQANGTPGISLSSNVITMLAITTDSFVTSFTVNSQGNGVFGTPGTGQSNGTVVTSVSLFTETAVSSLTPTTVMHTWSEGILTA